MDSTELVEIQHNAVSRASLVITHQICSHKVCRNNKANPFKEMNLVLILYLSYVKAN